MTEPRPRPERPPYSARPKTKQMDASEQKWETFSALPPPAPKVRYAQETATQTQTQTQSVATGMKLATWKKRIGAFALDFGVGLGACYLAQAGASLFGAGAEAVNLVGYSAFFAAWLVNRGYFQSRPAGQSLGKWLLNIKLIDTETEQAPTLARSVAREWVSSLLVLTEALVVPLMADGLFAVFDKEKRQSIHDRAGRTQVVEADQGYYLEEKAVEFLQEVLDGEAAADVKAAAQDLLTELRKNDTVADLTDQLNRLTKDMNTNTRGVRDQPDRWVDPAKKKRDNQ